jgi:glycosyltransferase involved in cell wall biosynthesis
MQLVIINDYRWEVQVMKGKILVISRNAWNNSNSTGNTATNFFSNWNDWEFANLFCRNEIPNNDICKRYFRISESDLLRGLFKSDNIGKAASYEEFTEEKEINSNTNISKEKRLYDHFRNNRWTLLLWAREILWSVSNWKNSKLRKFVKDFDPDIIYMPIHDCFYMHNVLSFVSKISKAKIVLITADDMYSLKQFSLSPLYWINRLILRKKIRNSITKASICYSMSDIQIKELSQEFGNKFKILRKGVDLKFIRNTPKEPCGILRFVYTGNITLGRWETIGSIGDAINSLNSDYVKATLEIYSTNLLTKDMAKKLNSSKEVRFLGAVKPQEVAEIQRGADVVIHAESFRLKSKLQTRLSFSTKLVDYFQNAKCILAVGWEKSNSIDYLLKNKAAIVVTDLKNLTKTIENIVVSKRIIEEFEKNAINCAHKNHNINEIQKHLQADFDRLMCE